MVEIAVLASSSRGNCYRVTDGRTAILLDCGLRFAEIQRALGFQVSGLGGCLLSHEHGDHAKAVHDLLSAGIDVYASLGTLTALNVRAHRATVVQAGRQFVVGTWRVVPFGTVHDAAEPLGFLLANYEGERLLYATDTAYIQNRFRGLTHVMLECNFALDILKANVESGALPPEVMKRTIRSHMSLEAVKEFLAANDLSAVREIHLLHLSAGNSDAERFKREIEALTGRMVFVADE